MIEEPESSALEQHVDMGVVLATSAIAIVEVPRAVSLANPSREAGDEMERLLAACMQVALGAELLRSARRLASAAVRTLDAIHLASALRIGADELLAYDHRLLAAAAAQGLAVASPGAGETV